MLSCSGYVKRLSNFRALFLNELRFSELRVKHEHDFYTTKGSPVPGNKRAPLTSEKSLRIVSMLFTVVAQLATKILSRCNYGE